MVRGWLHVEGEALIMSHVPVCGLQMLCWLLDTLHEDSLLDEDILGLRALTAATEAGHAEVRTGGDCRRYNHYSSPPMADLPLLLRLCASVHLILLVCRR